MLRPFILDEHRSIARVARGEDKPQSPAYNDPDLSRIRQAVAKLALDGNPGETTRDVAFLQEIEHPDTKELTMVIIPRGLDALRPKYAPGLGTRTTNKVLQFLTGSLADFFGLSPDQFIVSITPGQQKALSVESTDMLRADQLDNLLALSRPNTRYGSAIPGVSHEGIALLSAARGRAIDEGVVMKSAEPPVLLAS